MHVVTPEAAQVVGDQVRCAAGRVPDDEHVGVHGHQIVDRVEQGFAFGGGRTRDVEVDDVRRQALGGDLEGRARACRILEEDVEDALAAQQGHLLDVPVGDLEESSMRCRECDGSLRAAGPRSTAGVSTHRWR
jgi:hypothetical protein